MKLDPARLQHLREIARNRKGAYLAANDDRLDLREKISRLDRDRALMGQNYHPRDCEEALAAMDERIESARKELAAMQDREKELAQLSSTAGRTFQAALEFAQQAGLQLPDDLRPRTFGAPAPLNAEGA